MLGRLKEFNGRCRAFFEWAEGVGYKVQVYRGAQKWEDEVAVQARLVQKEVDVVEEGYKDGEIAKGYTEVKDELYGKTLAPAGDNSSLDEYGKMEEAVGNVEVSGERLVRNGDGKTIGTIVGKTIKKYVKGSVHRLKKPNAWAWDERAISMAKKAGCETLEIIDTEEHGKKYRASMRDMDEYGIRIERGYGVQRALVIEHWVWR